MKGQEHIGSHQQVQLRIRIHFPEGLHSQVRVTGALPLQLDVGHFDTRFLCHRQTQHRKPLLRRRGTGRNLLVGCDPVRNHQQLVKTQNALRLLSRMDMSGVDGIKGTAVDADFHRGSLLF